MAVFINLPHHTIKIHKLHHIALVCILGINYLYRINTHEYVNKLLLVIYINTKTLIYKCKLHSENKCMKFCK